MDESGVRSTPFVGKTWAPVGQTPVFVHSFNWEKLSIISALTSPPGLYFRVHRGRSVKGPQVVEFFDLLLRHIPGEVVVVLDGASQHRAKVVKEFVAAHPRLSVYRFPGYSPDFDPAEWVFGHLKTREVANLDARNTKEIAVGVRKGLSRMKRRKGLLRSFLEKTERTWGEVLRDPVGAL